MRKFLPLLLLSLSLGPLSAQDGVTVRFNIVSIGFDSNDVYMRDGSGYAPLKVTSGLVSEESYRYSGPMPMQLFERVGGEEGYKPISDVNFVGAGSGSGNFLLVFVKQGADGGVTASAVPYDQSRFPMESVCVVNTASFQVAIKLNDDMRMLNPGQSSIYPAPPGDDTRVHVAAEGKSRGQWKEVSNNMYRNQENQRMTIFIYDMSRPDLPPGRPPRVGFLRFSDGGEDAGGGGDSGPVIDDPAASF